MAALSYIWFTNLSKGLTETGSENIETYKEGTSILFKVESISKETNTVYLRNLGDTTLTNIAAYFDDSPSGIVIEPEEVPPGERFSVMFIPEQIKDQECTSVSGASSAPGMGAQQFTANEDGLLTTVELRSTLSGFATPHIFEILEDEDNMMGDVISSQTITRSGGWENITIESPIMIQTGDKYWISLSEKNGWMYSLGNPYDGGIAYFTSSYYNHVDFGFRTYVVPPTSIEGKNLKVTVGPVKIEQIIK